MPTQSHIDADLFRLQEVVSRTSVFERAPGDVNLIAPRLPFDHMLSSRRRPRGLPPGIGERLREERERLGMSQDALAEALGITRRTIYHYETEKYPIPCDFLDAVARVGTDVEYLVFARRSQNRSAAEVELVRKAVAFAAAFCRDPKGRPLPLDDETIEWIVRAYEAIAPARDETEGD